MSSPTCDEAESSTSIEWSKTCSQFTLHEIQLATQNFDESLVIGRGGFGKVYKGTIVNGAGHVVAAIKRLDSTSNQGVVEFRAEVEMLTKLRHCHLVSLLGYCNDGKEMILVYEYMPHGTLEDHLHDHPIPLSWMMRLKICIGAARGLDYLHTGTGISHGVIHRDVKSSNILLNKSWAAKIADFGLSKIGPTNQPSTYVNTLVKGTFGYLDPEYFYTGRLTRKSDVYSFGVVLFENLCRKRAVDRSLDEEPRGLARWAQDSIKEGRLKLIVDSNIRGQISPKCLKEFARLADSCLDSHPKQRPTMAQVVVTLESILALQEKTNNTMHPEGMTIFGRRVPMLLLPSTGTENSDGDRFLKSLELDFDIVGVENRKLYRFDFVTIRDATANFSQAIQIRDATANFSEATQIGRDGSYYNYYRGRLPNGREIATKKYLDDVTPRTLRRLINNELLLAKFEHENLLGLLGYCVEGTTVILIYEFAHCQSLKSMISDPVKRTLFDWSKRYKIIVGVARVLLYLHKHAPICVIHGDVKPGNIFLDQSLDPKLSNFEEAVRVPIDTTDVVVDRISGTLGYIAPEYLVHFHLSTKADVFGFGVLVLATITGQTVGMRRSAGGDSLVMDVWGNWQKGTTSNIIDPRIDDVDSSVATRMIQIGLLCVEEDEEDRPRMDEVVAMLTTPSLPLPLPKHTAYTPQVMLESEEYPAYRPPGMLQWEYYSDSGAADEFMSELHPR